MLLTIETAPNNMASMVSNIVSSLKDCLNKNSDIILNTNLFINLTPSMMKELLQRDDIAIDEKDLFEKLLEWGATHLPKERAESKQFHNNNCPYVYVVLQQGGDQKIRILDRSKLSETLEAVDPLSVKIIAASELREYLKELLPLIRFEHIDQEAIFKLIDSKRLFSADELLQFLRAAVSVKSKDPYSVMGVQHSIPRAIRGSSSTSVSLATPGKSPDQLRKDSTPEVKPSVAQHALASPEHGSAQSRAPQRYDPKEEIMGSSSPIISHVDTNPRIRTLSFTVAVETIVTGKGRLNLPVFQHLGTTWFVSVMAGMHDNQRHLSIYLYNRVITDGGTLKIPITTSITFRLINRKDPNVSRKRAFVKTWQEVKAWGYANVIAIKELIASDQGWLENGKFAVEVIIEHIPNSIE
jgi:hypothetical protein